MTNDNTPVIIYFDDPRGQCMVVSYKGYLDYWRLIGWTMQGIVPELPLEMAPRKRQGVQAGLL
jgi:hypothetical protein